MKVINSFFHQLHLDSFSFMFYALTSQTINSDATIKFYFNFLDEYGFVLPSPVEANCTIEEPVTEIDQSIGVAPASFKCLFNEEYVTDQVSSLQITSADGVAGLPIDDGILKNPKLTDQLIDLGKLTNPATEGGNLPSIINPGDYLVKYNEEQGVFTMVFEFTQGTVNVQADKFFRGSKKFISLHFINFLFHTSWISTLSSPSFLPPILSLTCFSFSLIFLKT